MKDDKPSFYFSVRFLMAILLFIGYCLNYMQKIDLSIAIVCMVNQTALDELKRNETGGQFQDIKMLNDSHAVNMNMSYLNTTRAPLPGDQCPSEISTKKKKRFDGPFVWDKSVQGYIMSAYFYGYIFTQLPGGWLSFRFGGRLVLAFSMGVGSLITLLIPICARIHYWALFACLFVGGVAHGAFWPSCSSFWAFWAPQNERSRLVGMASSGAKVGNIVGLSLGSILCLYGFDGGWPSIFYIFGAAGVVWAVVFFFVASDSPSTHRFISEKEKAYVLEETKKAIAIREFCQKNIPWLEIIKTKAVWSIFVGHWTHNWGNYLFLTQTPSFLKDVLKFDIKSNGFISSIPYIASWAFINGSSILSDEVMKRTNISRTNCRRLFSFLGLFTPGVIIVALSFVNCHWVILGVVLLTLGVAFDSIIMGAGYLININDIAGPYSGIIFGLSNTMATLPGIIAPKMTASITKNQLQSEWQIVFLISAAIYFIGTFFDLIFLDANVQSWAKIDPNSTAIEKEPINKAENGEGAESTHTF